jgi:glutamine synthetase
MVWVAEYIWLSGKDAHHDIRSKCKTMTGPAEIPLSEYPVWNFDGSSTGQAKGEDTEILVKAVAVYPHPFQTLPGSKVVLCECYYPNGQPTNDNSRFAARAIFDQKLEEEPWFGLEQEYVLFNKNGRPFGWPADGFPAPQGDYYCSNGMTAWGRDIVVEHYETCLNMGIKLSGYNAEVMPGQWEYQVGPCTGIESGDHMTLSRWVFLRLGEKHQLDINFESKPIKGDWNGSGCHTNFSTKAMRDAGGLAVIKEAIERLSKTFTEDVRFYGVDNDQRLTGKHETSAVGEFAWGVGTRHTSIRIPNDTNASGRGYFEDRRPSASADPYLVTARLFASALGVPNDMDARKLRTYRSWMDKIARK